MTEKPRSNGTIRAYKQDLKRFVEFLRIRKYEMCKDDQLLLKIPSSWIGMDDLILKSFIDWMIDEGYYYNSIIRPPRTVRLLAKESGVLHRQKIAMMYFVEFPSKDDIEIYQRELGIYGLKGGERESIKLSPDDIRHLKSNHDLSTAQGIRDMLMMILLLDYAMRLSDLAELKVGDIQLTNNWRTSRIFYTSKKNGVYLNRRVLPDLYNALLLYSPFMRHPNTKLLIGSHKSGSLLKKDGISDTGLSKRIKVIGERCGVPDLTQTACRRSCGQRAREEYGIAFAHSWLGHKDYKSTGAYTNIHLPPIHPDIDQF